MRQLSYLIITPYTILKSRTGGVLSRLLPRVELDLVAAQILTPDAAFCEQYADLTYKGMKDRDKQTADIMKNYILREFSPQENIPRRIMVLLFEGEKACEKLYSVSGKISAADKASDSKISGESIRDTYADLVYDEQKNLKYFEPAVLTPACDLLLNEKLKLFADFAKQSSNIVENLHYDDMSAIERTLVIIKPDNWRYPSAKPGNIIDMFSRTGLRIIACKIYQMAVSEALNFYGPVKSALREKLAPKIAKTARETMEKELKIKIDPANDEKLTEIFGIPFADEQFSQIIEFMSGLKPETCPEDQLEKQGKVKSMILIYEGKNAVKRIRDILGPTDPTKAPSGTIRKEFGKDIMINTAHASDSAENAKREMQITKINRNNFSTIISEYLKKTN